MEANFKYKQFDYVRLKKDQILYEGSIAGIIYVKTNKNCITYYEILIKYKNKIAVESIECLTISEFDLDKYNIEKFYKLQTSKVYFDFNLGSIMLHPNQVEIVEINYREYVERSVNYIIKICEKYICIPENLLHYIFEDESYLDDFLIKYQIDYGD